MDKDRPELPLVLSPSVLLSNLAPPGVADQTSKFLIDAYSEARRHYHTLQHIEHMLASLQEVRPRFEREEEVVLKLAIWFHDCVYDPQAAEAGKNERDSIERWNDFASEMVPPMPDTQSTVAALIEATISHQLSSPEDRLAAVFLDLDLAILAAESQDYDKYAAQIRREYAIFTDEQYRRGRIGVLETFLARDRLFMSEWFQSKEREARLNIRREIQFLQRGSEESIS